MNQVRLIGNVGKMPNIRSFSERKVVSFSLATTESYTKNEEKMSTTQWHNIVAWGKLAEQCEILISKGKLISIEGKIQTRHYLNSHEMKIYITEIIATKVEEIKSEKKEKIFFL